MQDPLMPWYTFGGKSTLSHHHDYDDHSIPRQYDTGSIPLPSRWSELTHNKQSFPQYATSAQYDQQYQLLRRTPPIIGYEFTSAQKEVDQEQLSRRAALNAAIEKSKSSISGRISRHCSSNNSRPPSSRPRTAPVRRPKSATSFISIGSAFSSSTPNVVQQRPQQRPRTAPTTRKEIASRLGDSRVNRITQVEFLQFSKAIPIHQRQESGRDTGSHGKSRNTHRSARRNRQKNDVSFYSSTVSNDRKPDPKHNHKSVLIIEQLLPSRTSTTATNDRHHGKKLTAWGDNHQQDQTIDPPTPSIVPVQQKQDHDDDDLRLARQAATKSIRTQDTNISSHKTTELKDANIYQKDGHTNPTISEQDRPTVSGEDHPTISRHESDDGEESLHLSNDQPMKEQDLQAKESQVRHDQSQQIKYRAQTKKVQHRLSVDDGSSRVEHKITDDDGNDMDDDGENGDDDRRFSVQSIQSEYIRSQSRPDSNDGELDDEGLEEFYRILSRSSSMNFKKNSKKSIVAKQDEKIIKGRQETAGRKNNVYLNIKETPIKLSRSKISRSRSHTAIAKKPNLTPTPSTNPDQDGQSSSKALLTPESNMVKEIKRSRSISAPPPLSEQAKRTAAEDGHFQPPEIRINEKDVVKVVIPDNDQSLKKAAVNRKNMGKNQVYNMRELLDIQMKTRRKHVAKVEEEKTTKEERKLSVGGSSHRLPAWLHSRIAFSKQACRFELPIDMKLLEEMTPIEYLAKHAVVSKRRKNLYSKYFIKMNSTADGLITFKELIKAIRDLHLNYITESQIKDVITLIKVEESMKFGKTIFCAICALIERMLYTTFTKSKYINIDYGHKELIEVTDFSALKWKLSGCKIQDDLLHLLQSL